MLVSSLKGGLGNQLFQWAIVKNLSLKYNKNFFLDTNFYNNQHNVTPRTFKLDEFESIKFSIFDNSNPNSFVTILDDFYFKSMVIEDGYNYYFDGYWQTEKYFIENEQAIRNDLKIPEHKKMMYFQNFKQLSDNSLSLHIRRKDYVTSNGYHPLCSIQYYENAIDFFPDYDFLFIFSDDIQWCKENLKFKNIIFVENQNDIDDLYMMSLCKNNIIANSSFSWWSAWLNTNQDKKIVAPNLWFGQHTNINTSDILPENWIKI